MQGSFSLLGFTLMHDLVHPAFDKAPHQDQQMKRQYALRMEGYNLHMLELVDLIASFLRFQSSVAVSMSKQIVFSCFLSADLSFYLKLHVP